MKNKLSILLADSDPVFLATYTGLLESPHTLGSLQWPGNYPVHAVGTHEQLWEVLERERPAILILDIALPDGDSREFMGRLRKSPELRTTPVIMTYPDEPMDDQQHFVDMTLGIDARLFEPIEPREILGFLGRILSSLEEERAHSMDTASLLIREIISDLQARKWTPNPMEKALQLAATIPQAIATFARAVMDELPRGSTVLDAALAFLPEQDWPALVQTAIEHLRAEPKNEAAESVITYASFQCLPAIHPFLSELFLISERFKPYYGTYAWRESGTAQIDFLTQQLHGDVESPLAEAEEVEPDCDSLRNRAFFSLLETRDPEAVRRACGAVPTLGYSSQQLSSFLAGVDLEQAGSGFRRLTPASVYHLQFPAGYVERPPYLDGTDSPTWENLSPEAYAYRFGGTLDTTCGRCGSPLHHLLTLEPLVEGLGVTGVPRLALATCLSCLGWEEEWLFFLHDAEGMPSAFHREQAVRPPRFLSSPLEETRVAIVETAPRWRWQDWGLSNSRENLHRLGGHPCWVQNATFPACPSCTRTMPFLMQSDSNLKTADNGCLLWGSGGIAYFFWCDACRLSATMWQCT